MPTNAFSDDAPPGDPAPRAMNSIITPATPRPARSGGRRGGAPSAGETTRRHILDTAEILFAELGPDAVSIRAIAASAGVNIAAVNYHFGSKERLFEEIFKRRIVPINRQRLELLDAAVAAAGPGGVPPLEAILSAFIVPPLRLSSEATGSARTLVVMQFLAHAFSSANEAAFLDTYYEPVRSRFIAALRAALPHLSLEDVLWRYNFVVGAIVYAMGGPTRMTRPPREVAPAAPVPAGSAAIAAEQLVAFAVSGLAAPSPARGADRPVLDRARAVDAL